VEQSEQWHVSDGGIYKATLSIAIANVPVNVSGTLELEPVAEGCVNHVRLNVDCSIPLVGKTLADFVAADCKRLVCKEYRYIKDRLSAG
jgi:hypothetical protein